MLVSFDSAGSPEIDVEVRGPSIGATRILTAIVDTGFTGFCLIPLHIAIDLGLIPDTSIDMSLADGSIQRKLAALGALHFEGQTCAGIMIIEDHNTEALIGMEFLKSFGLTLLLDAVASTLELRPSSA